MKTKKKMKKGGKQIHKNLTCCSKILKSIKFQKLQKDTQMHKHTHTHLVHIKTVTPRPRLQEVRSTHKQ